MRSERPPVFEPLPDLTQIKTVPQNNAYDSNLNYFTHNHASFSQNLSQKEYCPLPTTKNLQQFDGYTMQYSVRNDNYQQ